MKKIALFLSLIILLLSATSCYSGEAELIDENGKSKLIYHGNTYICDTEYHLESLGHDEYNDITVGIENNIIMAGGRYFRTLDVEKPLFIQEDQWSTVYFLEDFDYKAQTYVISGTDIEFKLEDFFDFPYDTIPEDFPYNFYNVYHESIEFRMKGEGHIGKNLELLYYNNRWCGHLYSYAVRYEDRVFAIKEDIANLLEEAGVLSPEKQKSDKPDVDYSAFDGIEKPLYDLLTNQAMYNERVQNYLYDLEFFGTPIFECRNLTFVYTDHDANNINELLIRHPSGALMYLATVPPSKWNDYKAGYAYYEMEAPTMTDLRDNGIFAWEYNFGKVTGFSQIRHTEGKGDETIELCRIEFDDNYENPKYFVNSAETSKVEYESFVSTLDGEILQWKKFPNIYDNK